MRDESQPLVSVAIPLFASKRFVSCITANIEAIDYPNVEILVSDRHGVDDSVDVLRRRFRDDPRITFIERSDRLTWVDHYNSLLGVASGRYFMWMPHDDSFPSHYIPRLVAVLEAKPQVVLAFGCIDAVTLADEPLADVRFYPPPFSANESQGLRDSLKLLYWGSAIPFRGIFRRDVVAGRSLYIRSSHESVGADDYWTFALSMVGRLGFVASCRCTKRYYPTSTHASSRFGIRHVIDGFRVLRSYIRDLSGGRRARVQATAGVFLWSLRQGASLVFKPLPDSFKAVIGRTLYKLGPLAIKPGLTRFR